MTDQPSLCDHGSRRVRMPLSDGHMDVSIPPCCDLDDRTLEALREIGEAAIARMKETEEEES